MNYVLVLAIILILILVYRAVTARIYGEKVLVYVYSSTCPHCIEFNKVWEVIKTKFPKTESYPITDYQARQKKIKSVPHIYIEYRYNGATITAPYTGPRTAEAILKWAS